MTKSRYLFKNITLLNLLLLGTIFFLANYTVLPLLNKSIQYTLLVPKKPVEAEEVSHAEPNPPSSSDYMIIADENLFHPERKIPPEKTAEQELPKPEFVLYGTMITDNISLAYLEDMKAPRGTPGRGKRQVALRKGDTLSGYKLKEIETDKIVMTRGDDKMTVYVHDPQRPKMRDTTAPVSQASSGQPPHTPQRSTTTSRPQQPLSPQSLIKPEPLTKTRAPMTPADAKSRDFFQRK